MMEGSREIPRELLLELLEDAHWAPTHGLTQPWRFHVFTGDGRAKLGDALQRIYDQITPAAEVPDKRAKLREGPLAAPVTIAVAAHVEPGGKISQLDEICATACAVQNLALSAHQRGIGSFWSTAPVSVSAEFKKWLGLAAADVALGLVYLGYSKAGVAPSSSRVPLAERVTWH